MAELRAAKLHAAGAGTGRAALSAFSAVAGRLEAALRDNAAATSGLEGALRAGLTATTEGLQALDAAGSRGARA